MSIVEIGRVSADVDTRFGARAFAREATRGLVNVHHFPHRHAETLEGQEGGLGVDDLRGLCRYRSVRQLGLDGLCHVGHDRGPWSVDRKDWRPWTLVIQLIFEVWGERTTLRVTEAVFPRHGRPSGGGGGCGRAGWREKLETLVF